MRIVITGSILPYFSLKFSKFTKYTYFCHFPCPFAYLVSCCGGLGDFRDLVLSFRGKSLDSFLGSLIIMNSKHIKVFSRTGAILKSKGLLITDLV